MAQVCPRCPPGFAHPPGFDVVGVVSRPDVVAVERDQLLPGFGGLLVLPEFVVFPATLVLPQLPLPPLGPERCHGEGTEVGAEPRSRGSLSQHREQTPSASGAGKFISAPSHPPLPHSSRAPAC